VITITHAPSCFAKADILKIKIKQQRITESRLQTLFWGGNVRKRYVDCRNSSMERDGIVVICNNESESNKYGIWTVECRYAADRCGQV
jgi:hypothetical protein